MFNNLYSFSKTAWHVNLFKWIYGSDPTKMFKTMCPYFWSYVITFLIFPLILIVKLFGKAGTEYLSKMESYKRDKQTKTIDNFIKKCSTEGLTTKEKYTIVKSKCWDKYYWYLDNSLYRDFEENYSEYEKLLTERRYQKSLQTEQKIYELKENKYFVYLSYLITLIVFSLLGYTIYSVYSMYEFLPVDWKLLQSIAIILVIALVIVITLYLINKFVLPIIFDYIKCTNCVICKWSIWKYIFKPFVLLLGALVLIVNMIYMTYKKACPIVTWKD